VYECGEDGALEHVVFTRLLPQRRQVRHQRARVRPDLHAHTLDHERYHMQHVHLKYTWYMGRDEIMTEHSKAHTHMKHISKQNVTTLQIKFNFNKIK